MPKTLLSDVLKKSSAGILEEWLKQQLGAAGMRADLIKEDELRSQSTEFLQRFQQATQSGELGDIKAAVWAPVTIRSRSISNNGSWHSERPHVSAGQ